MIFIAINISDETLKFVSDNSGQRKRIFEISGMPYSGASSAAISLIDKLSDDKSVNVIMVSKDTNINLELTKDYIKNRGRFIISFYTEDYKDTLLKVCDQIFSVTGRIDYLIIDDLWSLILHKNKSFIQMFFYMLNQLAKALKIRGIIIINQLRYDFYSKDNNYKTLYKEIIDPYLKAKLKVSRDNLDIYLEIDKTFKEAKRPEFLLPLNF